MVWCLGYPGILHFSLILAWSILPPIMQEILVTKQTWWSWCIFFICIYIYISNRYIKKIYLYTHPWYGNLWRVHENPPNSSILAAVKLALSLLVLPPVGSNLWGSTLQAIRGVVGGGGGPYASCCLSPLKLEPFKRGQWDPRKIPNLRGMLWNL